LLFLVVFAQKFGFISLGGTSKAGDKNSESLNVILSTVIFSKRRKISATLNRTQLLSPLYTASFYCTQVVVWVEREFGVHIQSINQSKNGVLENIYFGDASLEAK